MGGNVGRWNACDLRGLFFLPNVLESFPNTLVLTVPEETSTLLSTIVGTGAFQNPLGKDTAQAISTPG